jgi:hypothetical protein
MTYFKYNPYRCRVNRISAAFDHDIVEEVLGNLAVAIRRCHQRIEQASWEMESEQFDQSSNSESAIVDSLLGAAFVVSQTCIESVVSQVKSLHKYYRNETKRTLVSSTDNKKEILSVGSCLAKGSKFTEVAVIDACANYFKHRDVWSYPWSKATGLQANTIEVIESVGATPYDIENLAKGAQAVGIRVPETLHKLVDPLDEWRFKLYSLYQAELKGYGLL